MSTKTNEEWSTVPGSLPNITNSALEIPARVRGRFKYLDKDIAAIERKVTAIPREVEDVPK